MAAWRGSIDVAAGDLVERVDREGRRAVGGRKQVRVHAERRARRDGGVLVDAVRPHDLLGRRQSARRLGVGETDLGARADGVAELAPADREDPSGDPDLLLLRRERNGLVGLSLRLVGQPPRRGIEGERVAVLRVLHRLGRLDDVQPEVEGVAPEDVSHVVAAHDDELEALLLGHALQARGAHLARGADREPLAGDQKRLARVDPLAEVRHQVAERAGLPALVERVEALGDAVGGGSDLVGVDRVALPARPGGVPEDQGAAAHGPRRAAARRACRRVGVREGLRAERPASVAPARGCVVSPGGNPTVPGRGGREDGSRPTWPERARPGARALPRSAPAPAGRGARRG